MWCGVESGDQKLVEEEGVVLQYNLGSLEISSSPSIHHHNSQKYVCQLNLKKSIGKRKENAS